MLWINTLIMLSILYLPKRILYLRSLPQSIFYTDIVVQADNQTAVTSKEMELLQAEFDTTKLMSKAKDQQISMLEAMMPQLKSK